MAVQAQNPQVTVYSTSTCPWCVKAKQYLAQRGVPYQEKKVDNDRAAAIEMVRVSGQQGVPVIVVNDQVVVGFNQPRLEQLLSNSKTAGAAQTSRPTNNEPRRRTLGAQVADAQTITLRTQGRPVEGAFVGGVRQDSPAEWGGLKRGDIITAINNQPIRNAADLEQRIAATTPSSRLVITLSRNGAPQDVETVL